MLSPAQFKALIVSNLNSPYTFAIQLYLTKLIERQEHGSGIPQYRIKNTTTNTDIVSLADFIATLDELFLTPDYLHSVNIPDKYTVVHPIIVTIDNMSIEINKHADEDNVYSNICGTGNKKLQLVMTYLADLDNVIPLKIINVRLINI